MNQSFNRFLCLCAGALLLLASSSRADVKLAGVFGDHMVLQRDQPVPVWGDAVPGEKITVKFRTQEKTTIADDKGHWMVKLDSLTAGGPDKLIIGGNKIVELQDVLVGEVWVGSGQSNMALGVGWPVEHGDTAMAAIVATGPYPQIRHCMLTTDGHWQVASNINLFSGILFSFGLRVHQELNVPVGLICNAVSGSASSSWISQEALDADPTCQAAIKKFAATYDEAGEAKKQAAVLEQWQLATVAAKEKHQPEPPKPHAPYKPGEGKDGGVGCLYRTCVQPLLPYAIRGVLWDQGESGTALDGVDQYALMGALISSWRRSWGEGEFPFIYVQKPSGYGCAWNPTDPLTKNAETFLPLPATVPDDGSGDEINIKIRIMNYPKTAMVISSDLGSGTHPLNKSGYGHRAGDVALATVYGKKIEYYGPVYDSHAIEGATIRVHFRHAGQGLAFRPGDKLQGFAVAGEDKIWHWADAQIDGDSVVVSCEKVKKPVVVEYAWSAYRPWANFFNKDGLPAIPFRVSFTDSKYP